MSLIQWPGLTIHVLMTESLDGMSKAGSLIQSAGKGDPDHHARSLDLKRRIEDFAKANEQIILSVGDQIARLSEPLYSIIPSPLGVEPPLVSAWRCKGGMYAVASTIPLDHLSEMAVLRVVVDGRGAVLIS